MKDLINASLQNYGSLPDKGFTGRNMQINSQGTDQEINQEKFQDIIIETKHYNEITINEKQILNFPGGLLAFEKFTNFVILPEQKNLVFHWLQSLDDSKLAFLLMDPYTVNPDYVPDIFAYEIENLFGGRDLSDLKVWCIVTIPPNQPERLTINMQGPLIISNEKRLGGQFISNNESHLVRTPVLESVEAGIV